MNAEQLNLYLVTDRTLSLGRDMEWIVSEAVKGGVSIVQLREKDCDTGEFIELARKLKNLLSPLGVPLLINDRVDVALAADADGVHIGQSDMSYADARRLLGKDKIIGLSVENMEDLLAANETDVDYVAVSPVYATGTKTDTAAPFGLDGLREAVKLSKHPTVAIGGMNAHTAKDVMDCGACGIAVVSAIVGAESPMDAARELKSLVQKRWTERIWEKSLKIYNSILEEPFIKELADGTLPNEKFARYIAQDEVYLGNYGRQMFELAEQMEDISEKEFFMGFAKSGMESEKLMHELLIRRFGIDTEVTGSEVTKWYNDHTQKAVDCGIREVGLAGLLPCAWIYNKVGLHILRNATLEGNPYKEWIMEYGNPEFTEGVTLLLDLIDDWAEKVDAGTLELMDEAYLKSALGEYAFWDYGYRGGDGDYSYLDDLEQWI